MQQITATATATKSTPVVIASAISGHKKPVRVTVTYRSVGPGG
jgi:hypothetical protein